jgi:dual specificity tyrosine-phosphorylation-regulated kinase 2/3/4
MWSFGCIIAELYTGIPIFPGESEHDQLNYIMEYLGIPDINLLEKARKKSQFFDENNNPIKLENTRGRIRIPITKKISKFLKGADDKFIDLIKKCLVFDPTKRIKPEEALLHPWFSFNLLVHSKENTKDIIFQQTKSLNTSPIKTKNSLTIHNKQPSFTKYQTIFKKLEINNVSESNNINNNKKESPPKNKKITYI